MSDKHIVLITGANTGLGLEVVKALYKSDEQYEIILGSRSIDKANDAIATVKQETQSSQSNLSALQVDVSSDESIHKAFEQVQSQHGKLDTLINNAGASFDYAAQQGQMSIREAFNTAWDVNVSGTHVMTHEFVPLLLKSSSPRLLFVTSGTSALSETERFDYPPLARLNASPEAGWPKPPSMNPVTSYRSSKTGLNMLMREWAKTLGNDGVKVFGISPGFLATGLAGMGPEQLKKMGARDPSEGGSFMRDVVQVLTCKPLPLSRYCTTTIPYTTFVAAASQIAHVPSPGNEKRKHSEDSDADDGDEAPVRKRAILPRRPCIICADDVPKNRFPKIPHKQDESNRHGSDVCFKCYRQHLGVDIKNKSHEAVSCPQCSKTLQESEVRKLASSRTYQDYIDKAAKNCMQQDEEYHSCPNAKCPWGAFFAKDDGNILNCRMCKARYCLDCEIPFHEGQNCEQYQADAARRTEEEQKSLETVQNTSRPCPNPTCGVNIDKYIGCDHVTCRRCRHEFCWECFAPYHGPQGIWQIGNSAHNDTCRYAPRSLPEYRQPSLFDDDVDDDDEEEDSD